MRGSGGGGAGGCCYGGRVWENVGINSSRLVAGRYGKVDRFLEAVEEAGSMVVFRNFNYTFI